VILVTKLSRVCWSTGPSLVPTVARSAAGGGLGRDSGRVIGHEAPLWIREKPGPTVAGSGADGTTDGVTVGASREGVAREHAAITVRSRTVGIALLPRDNAPMPMVSATKRTSDPDCGVRCQAGGVVVAFRGGSLQDETL
jgi:hypothetical protein